MIQGRRVYPDERGILGFAPGDYGKDARGIWMCRCPDPDIHVGSLEAHTVVEHEDGTITVSPSILITESKQWHGYLERGEWREC